MLRDLAKEPASILVEKASDDDRCAHIDAQIEAVERIRDDWSGHISTGLTQQRSGSGIQLHA